VTSTHTWIADELRRIGDAEEIQIAPLRPDGSLRPYTTIWVVRSGDHVYVRSAYGWNNGWFQRALKAGEGRIRAGGVERDVRFEQPGPEVADDVSAAYHAKYDRHGARSVGTVVSEEAARSTLRILPR
jgi:hypothetical protein